MSIVPSDGSTSCAAGVSERMGSMTTFGLLVSSGGTPQGPFGFVGAQGYQEDADSGLKLLGHRYYDPSTGRFLTRDPAKDGRNWYAYCENEPTGWYDDEGEGKKPPRYRTRKDAEDGARNRGKGKPIHHPNPADGGYPHFHPVDEKGNKIPGDHHTYPRPNSRPPGVRQSQVAGGTAVAVVALWGVWEVGKWGAAVLAAPETGGLSLAGAAALP